MREAFVWACLYIHQEHPQYTYPTNDTNNLGNFLTIKGTFGRYLQFPSDYDLFVRDNQNDNGQMTNITTMTVLPYTYFVDSPDIWARINDDNLTTNQIICGNSKFYVYVRVRNCGTTASSDLFDTLQLYMAPLSLAPQWNTNLTSSQSWQKVGESKIPTIEPNDVKTFCFEVPHSLLNNQYSFLTRISSIYEPMQETTSTMTNVANLNNVAARNIMTIAQPCNSFILSDDNRPSAITNIGASGTPTISAIRFLPIDDNDSLLHEAEVYVTLSGKALNYWPEAGRQTTGFRQINDSTFLITSKEAELSGFFLPESEDPEANIRVSVNYITSKSSDKSEFNYSVSQYNINSDELLGAIAIKAIKPDRDNLFRANAGNDTIVNIGSNIHLSAQNIGEDAIYKWYSMDNTLLHNDLYFDTNIITNTSFILEVTATTDGFKDYDTVNIYVKNNYISSISPNPSTIDFINISYTTTNVNSAEFVVYHTASNLEIGTYQLNVNSNHQRIDVSKFKKGTYLISLICDGISVDNKIFVKQ